MLSTERWGRTCQEGCPPHQNIFEGDDSTRWLRRRHRVAQHVPRPLVLAARPHDRHVAARGAERLESLVEGRLRPEDEDGPDGLGVAQERGADAEAEEAARARRESEQGGERREAWGGRKGRDACARLRVRVVAARDERPSPGGQHHLLR